ncbi:MAG: nucleotidyltransferase, partial [Oscillospiraceae bacterium]|nr:nucleotidyltransferase [Oscillospiraceae bacterium]
MAAGMGSRYGGLKQMDPVGPNGEFIIDYSLYDAHRAGFETVVFIIKPDIEEAFRETVGQRASAAMEVRYAFQTVDLLPEGYTVPEGRVKPWGTGHAILSASGVIDAPFAVINADDYYGVEAFRSIYQYLSQAREEKGVGDYCMVGYLLKNTVTEHGSVSRGVCQQDAAGHLTDITEHTQIEQRPEGICSVLDSGEEIVLPGDT